MIFTDITKSEIYMSFCCKVGLSRWNWFWFISIDAPQLHPHPRNPLHRSIFLGHLQTAPIISCHPWNDVCVPLARTHQKLTYSSGIWSQDAVYSKINVDFMNAYKDRLGAIQCASQKAKFMGPTWGQHGSCRPQMGTMLAPWTLLSGVV